MSLQLDPRADTNTAARQNRAEATQPVRAVLVSPRLLLREAVSAAFGRIDKAAPCVTTFDFYVTAAKLLDQRPEICMVDIGSSEDEAMSLVQELSEARVPVIALHTVSDPDLILRGLRHGAVEYLYLPIEAEDLERAFQRLNRGSPGAEGRPGRLITLMPAKPNYGATTISCNLALQLARGEPQAGRKPSVFLADLDSMLGNIGFLLRLKSPFGLADAAIESGQIDQALWRKIPVAYRGLEVLLVSDAPKRDPFDLGSLPVLSKFLRKQYGICVLDSPGPATAWHRALARQSDDILLVTTNELTAIHATRRALRIMEEDGIEKSQLKLILNRFERDGGLAREAVESALELKVYSVLPNDPQSIRKAILDGGPVEPSSKFGRGVDKLCRLLAAKPALRKTGFLESLFSKRKRD